MPQPTSAYAKDKVEEVWQRYLPFSVQRAVQNALRLRAPLCLEACDRGASTKTPRAACLLPSEKQSPCKMRGKQFTGSGLSSDERVNFTPPSVLWAPSSLPADSQTLQIMHPEAAEVLFLERYLSCSNSMDDHSSYCHDSDVPLGTKESVQGRTW